ncbi:hypothetical protein EI982_00890 (plasmid) [Haloplanus rallus]|uniref:Uncharacterized protein n=1 Tax=Haloplanus rallus TaxID=1816183 RepID=A0A6B9FCJ4_9EURY|nr:hypothetical protein [Haloplanus rallus]QGX93429.1 hypothetical protein EI982_00890 [Haloplanus rallus]
MTEDQYCGDCGGELELVTEHTAANSTESVGGQYRCPDCGDELVIVELGGSEVTRVPLPR